MESVLDIVAELPPSVDGGYLSQYVLDRLQLDPEDFEKPSELSWLKTLWFRHPLTEAAARRVRTQIRNGLHHFPDPPPAKPTLH